MLKRLIDIALSSTAIIVLCPLLLPISLLLRFTGEGKVFYIQERLGKDGKLFGLVKFATMLENSPRLPGGDVTFANDPRVLPLGRVLRKTKVNELPQLLNILNGSMSFVGPRPLTPRTFGYYPMAVQAEIATLRPGLTGIGSIVFRDEEKILESSPKSVIDCFVDDIAPYKGELEVWYKKRSSLWLDFLLILLTVWVVLFPNSDLHFRLLRNLPRNPLVNKMKTRPGQ